MSQLSAFRSKLSALIFLSLALCIVTAGPSPSAVELAEVCEDAICQAYDDAVTEIESRLTPLEGRINDMATKGSKMEASLTALSSRLEVTINILNQAVNRVNG